MFSVAFMTFTYLMMNPYPMAHQKNLLYIMFGKNVEGKTYSILVRNFKPFFFVLVPNGKRWDRYNLNAFIKNLKTKCGDYEL